MRIWSRYLNCKTWSGKQFLMTSSSTSIYMMKFCLIFHVQASLELFISILSPHVLIDLHFLGHWDHFVFLEILRIRSVIRDCLRDAMPATYLSHWTSSICRMRMLQENSWMFEYKDFGFGVYGQYVFTLGLWLSVSYVLVACGSNICTVIADNILFQDKIFWDSSIWDSV